MRRLTLPLDLLLLVLLAAVLIKPLFKLKYLARWDSIESSFIADGRFLRDHWAHAQWQPLWYDGTREAYIYPPAVRYGTALLARIWIPAKAYHIYTAFFYCLGISGVYFLARLMSGSRGAGWLAAAAAALVSPVYLLVSQVRDNAEYRAPWRLWVLTRYGEGPHISALALLPFALALVYLALRRASPALTGLAAVLCAGVAATNFYGATALGAFFPILVWSVWATHREASVWLRAAAIGALAGGLCAFWLVPSYLRLTMLNLKWFSPPGDRIGTALNVVFWIGFILLSLRLAARRRERTYATFLAGSVLWFGLNVLGYYWFQVKALAEPVRLAPELDLVLILGCTEAMRRMWNWHADNRMRRRLARASVVLLALAGIMSARGYLRHAWQFFPAEQHLDQRVEYRLADWAWRNLPQSRFVAAGSVRFWWTAWHDLPEVTGAMERCVMNQYLVPAMYEVMVGDRPELSVDWLQALGADAIVVNDRQSQEPFHDYVHPEKFAGILPVLYDDHQGNVIYGVPRRYPALARVVDAASFRGLPPLTPQTNLEALRAYTAAIEQGPDSTPSTGWEDTGRLRIHARIGPGQSLVAQITYDPAWRAYVAGRRLPVHPDAAGLSLIEVPPGEQDIEFVFETPLEYRVGAALTWLSLAIVVGLLAFNYIHRQPAQ